MYKDVNMISVKQQTQLQNDYTVIVPGYVLEVIHVTFGIHKLLVEAKAVSRVKKYMAVQTQGWFQH